MVKFVCAAILAFLVGLLTNIVSGWLTPYLEKWKVWTVAALVGISVLVILLTLPKTSTQDESLTVETNRDSIYKIPDNGKERFPSLQSSKKSLKDLRRFVSSGKYGYKDDTLVVIPPQFDLAEEFSDYKAVVYKNNVLSVIDTNGKQILSLPYLRATGYSQNRLPVFSNTKAGYVDGNGNLIIPLKYEGAWKFHQGRAKVELNGKRGFIDTVGNVVVPIIYDDADYFQNGRTYVTKNRLWGIIDLNGKFLTKMDYDFASHFSGGFALMAKGGKFEFLDLRGLYPPWLENSFDEASEFTEKGVARVRAGAETFCIDTRGLRTHCNDDSTQWMWNYKTVKEINQ